MPDSNAPTRSARSLRRRLVTSVAAAAMLVLVVVGYAGLTLLERAMVDSEDARIVNAANLSGQLVERVLDERARQVELVASVPSVIAAAEKGAAQAASLGLPTHTWTADDPAMAPLDNRFPARSLQVDESTDRYLTALLPKLEIAEVMVTDKYGYNAVTTSRSSDFIQSDEAWWQNTWAAGLSAPLATADPAVQKTVVEQAALVRDGATKVGVVKVKFGLTEVDSVLAQGGAADRTLRVDLVDSAGKVIASSVASTRFKPLAGFAATATHLNGVAFTYAGDSSTQRAAAATANAGRWRVVAHIDDAEAMRPYHIARDTFVAGVVIVAIVLIVLLGAIGRFVEQRITGPAADLAAAAEAVAAGDLSRDVSEIAGDDEIARLARSISAMIAELRRLATALNESARETGAMTAEITASSEEMAASAGQIAHTAADLSQQSNGMADTIQSLARSSEHLVGIAGRLDAGATEGVDRNATLRGLAVENRARLDESSRSLASLSDDVEASAAAIEHLAEASEEVRSFVTLVQKMARQSKLLALNAAMEAARAGEHGHGFAVVAEEVRRLAATSADAGERTEHIVTAVLERIAASRASTGRTVDTVRTVRTATEQGSRSFGQIETALAATDEWTGSIRQTVTAANDLAHDMRSKLDSLSTATESFAAAMEEVAASSEEQSASTEQIAAAASTLAGAAERLTRLAANLRLERGRAGGPGDERRPSGPVAAPPDVGIGRPTPIRQRAVSALDR